MEEIRLDVTKYKYCFIDTVYEGSGTMPSLYQLVLSDSLFRQLAYYKCSSQHLQEFYHDYVVNPEHGLVADFVFEENFLKFNSGVRTVPSNNLLEESNDLEPVNSAGLFTLYDLILRGVSQDFCILEDELAESDTIKYLGDKVYPFSGIKFAKSTMTVYLAVVNNSTLYHNNLVVLDGGVLTFRPFYFTVPATAPAFQMYGCAFVRAIELNNKKYNLWHAEYLPLYDEDVSFSISKCLINKAICERERKSAALRVQKYYKESLFGVNATSKDTLKWTGGDTDRRSFYGVVFKSSISMLTEKECFSIVNTCLTEIAEDCNDLKEAKAMLMKKDWTTTAKFAGMCLLSVMLSTEGNVVQQLAAVHDMQKFLEECILFADLYLYRVRANAYIKHLHLANGTDPRIFGANEREYTLVEEGFYYGFD